MDKAVILVQEMIHYRNSLAPLKEPDGDKVSEFERCYSETLKKTREEYKYIPPSEYYKNDEHTSLDAPK